MVVTALYRMRRKVSLYSTGACFCWLILHATDQTVQAHACIRMACIRDRDGPHACRCHEPSLRRGLQTRRPCKRCRSASTAGMMLSSSNSGHATTSPEIYVVPQVCWLLDMGACPGPHALTALALW